jgi:hypothetical protein
MAIPLEDSRNRQIREAATWRTLVRNQEWTYRRGDKVVVCRPMRPSGRGWIWHREGNRYGWYHSSRKAWHNDRW